MPKSKAKAAEKAVAKVVEASNQGEELPRTGATFKRTTGAKTKTRDVSGIAAETPLP